MRTTALILAVAAAAAVSARQGAAVPANAASYEVRFSFQGHLGSLASAPDCPVRRDGKAVMSGILAGVETVPEGDDIAYRGVLRLAVALDLCDVARRRGRRASSERRPTAPAGRRQTTKN